MVHWLRGLVLVGVMTLHPGVLRAEVAQPLGRLLFFSSPACHYCGRFAKEIGQAYPQTDEGRLLPLVEVDSRDPPEEWKSIAASVTFTPTLVVLDNKNRERARFRGYKGDQFFWWELTNIIEMLKKGGDETYQVQ
ncbi:MAG: thioredoxin family protein [Magnetococcus sp. WYHC-3]